MVYRILYYLVNVLIRIFYRKLYINGLHHIDKNKTYLITSNHPNGFFEPLIMACTFPIDLYFMVRGDMFEKPIMNWFLRSTHQIPIFRFVDGYSKMKENQSSLSEATARLNDGNSILVFAEGSTEALMKCRRIQKGTAKMAYQTFEEYPQKQLEILPVGINFENWSDAGGEVVLNIGKPFPANPYYENDPSPRGIIKLTQDIETAMKNVIIHVENVENEDYIRKYWQLLNLSQPAWPRKDADPILAQRLKSASLLVNEQNQPIKNLIDLCYQEAHDLGSGGKIFGKKNSWMYLLGIIGIPGMLFHLGPILLGLFMRKNKVKRDAFRAPIFGISAYFSSIFLYIILAIIGTFTLGFGTTIAALAILAVSGFCFLLYWENHKKINTHQLSETFTVNLAQLNRLVDEHK